MRVCLREVSFSGHETFPFRWRWLKKGVDATTINPDVFASEEALVSLGVGKNMVRAIRHWCMATGLIEHVEEGATRAGGLEPTDLGRALLGDDGWDPFMDDVGTLWLLHWLLVSDPTKATTWYLAFTALYDPDFTKDRLVEFVEAHAAEASTRATRGSLGRDVDCFLRTYVPARGGKVLLEDSLECPLVELSLISALPGTGAYRFSVGPKPSLPPLVFGYALACYLQAHSSGSRSMSLDQCLYGPGSPGQAFKLDEGSFGAIVERVAEQAQGCLGMTSTAGITRVSMRESIPPIGMLQLYYDGNVAG